MKNDQETERERVDDVDRGRLERVVPEIIKRILEAGYEKIAEGPENVRRVVGDLKLPKEALSAILTQIDETKSGVYRVVAREVREFLERTNFAEELTRALTAVSFEIRTSVRFVPNSAAERSPSSARSRASASEGDENAGSAPARGSDSTRPSRPPAAVDADHEDET